MDDSTLWRAAITVLGIVGTLGVTLIGIILGRIYKSIDLLFARDEKRQKQINVLKLAALKNDPDGTALFEALTGNGRGE